MIGRARISSTDGRSSGDFCVSSLTVSATCGWFFTSTSGTSPLFCAAQARANSNRERACTSAFANETFALRQSSANETMCVAAGSMGKHRRFTAAQCKCVGASSRSLTHVRLCANHLPERQTAQMDLSLLSPLSSVLSAPRLSTATANAAERAERACSCVSVMTRSIPVPNGWHISSRITPAE
eukprot:6182368-Pleurochrysis_carterae.AAC.2